MNFLNPPPPLFFMVTYHNTRVTCQGLGTQYLRSGGLGARCGLRKFPVAPKDALRLSSVFRLLPRLQLHNNFLISSASARSFKDKYHISKHLHS